MNYKKFYEALLYIFLVLPLLPLLQFFHKLQNGLLLSLCLSLSFMYFLIKFGQHKFDFFRTDTTYPLAIYSWILIGSIGGVALTYGTDILGAFNPKQYFQREIEKHGTQNCEMFSTVAKSASDSLRVSINKYNMGIETIADLEASRNAYKLLNDSLNQCLQDEQTKINLLNHKLDKYLHSSHWYLGDDKYFMLINEVISPLKKYIATVNVKGTQAKTMIDAESTSQARLLLGKMYGEKNVVSVSQINLDETLITQPLPSQIKHNEIINDLTNQITQNANKLKATKQDKEIALKRYKTNQKRVNREYEKKQRISSWGH